MTLIAIPRLPVRPDAAWKVATLAGAALFDELKTWPKPGLVSLVDNGSHDDMDAVTLARSAAALEPFFGSLAEAGERRAAMPELRRIGIEAEAAMMAATGGINAHRGAIFSLGLICAAAGAHRYLPQPAGALAEAVAALWGPAILRAPVSARSNGGQAVRRFGVGGAREEAAMGFPTLRSVGLPALHEGRRLRPGDPNAARVHCLFALIAAVDDTNLLHRGGLDGLAFAQAQARMFAQAGGVADPDWLARAKAAHSAFVARKLSPGGAADLLSATLFLDMLETVTP